MRVISSGQYGVIASGQQGSLVVLGLLVEGDNQRTVCEYGVITSGHSSSSGCSSREASLAWACSMLGLGLGIGIGLGLGLGLGASLAWA